MKLKELVLTNFMSIRSATIKLENQGLLLIQGDNSDSPAFKSNGAGKSTMFEGLVWVMFDETIRGLSSDEVVNNTINKNCSSVLDFEDDNGIAYRIARYRKHTEHKNAVKIFKNGENITPKSAKDANKLIIDLFGLDFATFVNSIIFGQGLIKMFSVASDAEKKEILERMLQQDIFKKCLEIAKYKRGVVDNELSSVENSKLRAKDAIYHYEEQLEGLEKLETEHKQKVEEELFELRNLLAEAITEEKSFSTTTGAMVSEVDQINDKLDEIEEKLANFEDYENGLRDLKAELADIARESNRAKRETDEFLAEAEKIADGKGTNCPACKRPISDDIIEESLRHVFVKVKELKETMKELLSDKEMFTEQISKVEKFLETKQPLLEEKASLQRRVMGISATIRAEADTERRLKRRREELTSMINQREKDLEKTYKPLIEKAKSDIEEQKADVTKYTEESIKLTDTLEKIKFWVNGFGNSGVKSYLLDSVTPFLNKRANEYLGTLAGNTVQIEFSTQTQLASGEMRDKFDVRIFNTIGGGTYKANSGGERRRIDLAIALALQDLVMMRGNGKLNMVVYDEIFDTLDDVGCESAIQLLQDMGKRVESIFVITHNDILKSYFDRYLVVTKKDGVTSVERVG